MIWRLAVVAGAIALALLLVRMWERRSPGEPGMLQGGLTLVTGADCRLCPRAVAATADADIPVRIVDIGELSDSGIRSLPTALVTDRAGTVIASRSGRSAISDMSELIAMARRLM